MLVSLQNRVCRLISSVSSGSAFPATLAFQIRELQRETEGDIRLDAILTVIDAINFTGYEDTSPTARMQASYTDMIIIASIESTCRRPLLTPSIRINGNTSLSVTSISWSIISTH